MKEDILKLRLQGKTYGEIKKILGCSKGTISYHCGEGQKEKVMQRTRNRRNCLAEKIKRKVEFFLRPKLRDYRRGRRRYTKLRDSRFKIEVAYKRIYQKPFCYLTGRKIDLADTKSYQLDHKIPSSRNGKDTLENMGLTCKEANMSKRNLTVNEFIKLCKEVCKNNGYSVIKNKGTKH